MFVSAEIPAVKSHGIAELKSRSGILESQAGNGMIGDWQIKRCEPEGIRLVVNPGYGASRKMSYTQLDVSAVLSYTFALRPTSAPQLFINGLKVSSEHIRSAFELDWNLNFPLSKSE